MKFLKIQDPGIKFCLILRLGIYQILRKIPVIIETVLISIIIQQKLKNVYKEMFYEEHVFITLTTYFSLHEKQVLFRNHIPKSGKFRFSPIVSHERLHRSQATLEQ